MVAERSMDATARSRITAYLLEHGPVADPRGGATSRLREAIGYQGSAIAFIQLITAMDGAGEIVREIRGKRTYAIGAARAADLDSGHSAPDAESTVTGVPAIDYDRLARALLRELGRVLASAPYGAALAASRVPLVPADRTAELANERDLLRAERDEYASQLGTARRQLDALLALYVRDDRSEPTATVDSLQRALMHLRAATFAEAEKKVS
jgi:hypothetical protein